MTIGTTTDGTNTIGETNKTLDTTPDASYDLLHTGLVLTKNKERENAKNERV